MAVFKCYNCEKWKFFVANYELQEKYICEKCYQKAKEIELSKKRKKQLQLQEEKRKRREEKQRLADLELKRQLLSGKKEKKKSKNKKSQEKFLTKKPVAKKVVKKLKQKTISKEKQAEIDSQLYQTLLYILATVKRLKVIEWQNGKKRVILNKEREIRKTHKGGFSQEKFQKFVKFQKSKAWDWIESNLTKPGTLRPPYEKVIIECDNSKLKLNIEQLIKKINEKS